MICYWVGRWSFVLLYACPDHVHVASPKHQTSAYRPRTATLPLIAPHARLIANALARRTLLVSTEWRCQAEHALRLLSQASTSPDSQRRNLDSRLHPTASSASPDAPHQHHQHLVGWQQCRIYSQPYPSQLSLGKPQELNSWKGCLQHRSFISKQPLLRTSSTVQV